MARILILGDERKGAVRDQVVEVAEALRGDGHEIHIDLERDSSLENRRADLVAVFGGDGSLLAAARRMGDNQLPTLGINLGRLGFLTAFGDDEALSGVRRALEGELIEEPRAMLRCRADCAATSLDVRALNDVVIARGPRSGILTLSAERDGRKLAMYPGDGLIVATSIGSTAYSLAVGGPVVAPQLEAIVLSPLAPHSLALRPLVVPLDGVVTVRVEEAGADECAYLTIDGQVHAELPEGGELRIEPAASSFRHLTRGPDSFFTTLRTKFGWGSLPRRPEV